MADNLPPPVNPQNEGENLDREEVQDTYEGDRENRGPNPEQSGHHQAHESDYENEPITMQGIAALMNRVIDDRFAALETSTTTTGNPSRERRSTRERAVSRSSESRRREREVSSSSRHRRRERGCSYQSFVACKPPEFGGAEDPIKAMEWITSVEKVFRISKCIDDDRVMYATALLTGHAMMWWEAVTSAVGQDLIDSFTWGQFKIKFNNQYCPPDVLVKLEREFMDLKQGTMSIISYEREYSRKSRFAPHQIPTEEKRIFRFVQGMKPEIREFVENRDLPTYEKAFEYARTREQGIARSASEMPQFKKAKVEGSFGASRPPVFSNQGRTQSYSQSNIQQSFIRRTCPKCGKAHGGECRALNIHCFCCGESGHVQINCPRIREACYECGVLGHQKRNCPRLNRTESQALAVRPNLGAPQARRDGVPVAKARAYQMVADDVRKAQDDATGSKRKGVAD